MWPWLRGIVELACASAVKEAQPLVPVEHEHPFLPVARDAYQHPVTAGRERHLDGAPARPRTLPSLRLRIDAEIGNCRFDGHGILATPQ
jgi:hypothetical protein